MTEFSRRVKDILVGLGFQEMVYTYLGSRQDYIGKMVPQGEEHPHGDTVIRIANPMSENYEFVRQSIIPSLLASESVSGNAVYPHKIFEIGKVAWLDESQNSGTRTSDYLGFLTADRDVDFTSISSHVSALFFYLNKEYRLEESSDPRFIKGRSASIMYNDTKVGIFGEVHPGVLEQWGIQMPSTACEIDLNLIM
jgi:phenylalanyl-tRNA synthetase beta chain